MPSTSGNVEQPEDRRRAIILAASRVFAEKGFSGASNREIAREAGISPGLIYWYFRDKDELFIEVVRELFPLAALRVPEDAIASLPIRELLLNVGGQFMSIMTSPDVLRLARLAISELIRFPEVWREIGALIGNQAVGRLAAELDRRIARGELSDVDSYLVAQSFFGSLIAWVLRKYLYQSVDLAERPDADLVRTVVDIYCAGLERRVILDTKGSA